MKLNYKRTLLIGFAFFLITVFWQAYDTIVPKILTDRFGMSQTISGMIMAADNVLALVLLPLFGSLSDKTHTRYGRRTPYIFCGTIAAALLTLTLSVSDSLQLQSLEAVNPQNPTAQATLYDTNLEITTPAGNELYVSNVFTREEFIAINIENADGSANSDYTNYVVPLRQAYAAEATSENNTPLFLFVVTLFMILLSMSTFRSPAVALMPDVTIKPLRSKANAVINLMGAAGGILVLIMGGVLGTGAAENALMSYSMFFALLAGIMLASLFIFMRTVRENDFVRDMQLASAQYGIDETAEGGATVEHKLSRTEFRSLVLILISVALWFFGYNAVTSKYSVYASSVLNIDYNLTLTLATAAAILTYLPVGIIASKFGRKRTIMAGIIILGTAFFAASFIRSGSSVLIMNLLFCMAGVGWATINVNSYPMVVELAGGSDTGKYTGFYYTASMAAQTATPVVSGFMMDKLGMSVLFPYGTVFVLLAFVSMMFVMHGDNKPQNLPVKGS